MAVATAALVIPPSILVPGSARAATSSESTRRLSLVDLDTGARFDGAYWADGRYLPEALRKLDVVLRDNKSGQTCKMDPHLFDQLWELQQTLGLDEPFEVVCGYRSRKTNAMARRRSRGVAKQSLHMSGKAIDIRIHEKSVKSLATAAREMQAGGVGYYPRNGFVHIDTGPVRTW